MDSKKVKDLMVMLDEYAVVPEDASLLDAILALEDAQKHLPPGRHPYRAVLVVDANKNIVGKIGQLAFIKALEPKYKVLGDLETLAKAGIRPEFISSIMEHYQFFQNNFPDLCLRGRTIAVKDIMRPITESIDENASVYEAMHQMVMLQTLSLLVMREKKVIGLLRLSDLFDAVSRLIKEAHSTGEGNAGVN